VSLTAIIWFSAWIILSVYGLFRPLSAVAAYLLVFYTNPVSWWFGSGFLLSLTNRWALLATVILIVSLFLNGRFSSIFEKKGLWFFFWGCLFLMVNASVVHYNLAANVQTSARIFDQYWKGLLGALLLVIAINDQDDLELFLAGVVSCTFFACFEIIVGGQGGMERGRLEGFQFSGATGSNGGSVVLLFSLPIFGYFLVSPRKLTHWLGALVGSVFTLETLFRCNSRGAYVGLIAGGLSVLALSKGATRRKALLLVFLGSLGILAIAKNDAIWNRFQSIFAEEEERDEAADSRIFFWKSAVEMIADYPFGSGGKAAFYSDRGKVYIQERYSDFRSVHNGPLDIAAAWGIQGIAAFLLMYTVSAWSVFKKTSLLAAVGNERESFMGICILGVMAGSFVSSFFTSVLDGEWFMWIIGAGLCFSDAPLRNGDPTLQSSIPFDGQLEENGSSVEEERLQAYGTRK
jgi:O-antigen ligase